jgi:hypothetical protein
MQATTRVPCLRCLRARIRFPGRYQGRGCYQKIECKVTDVPVRHPLNLCGHAENMRADRSIYAALETMQALLDTHGSAQLVVVDFSADVARVTVHVAGAGRDSVDTCSFRTCCVLSVASLARRAAGHVNPEHHSLLPQRAQRRRWRAPG